MEYIYIYLRRYILSDATCKIHGDCMTVPGKTIAELIYCQSNLLCCGRFLNPTVGRQIDLFNFTLI